MESNEPLGAGSADVPSALSGPTLTLARLRFELGEAQAREEGNVDLGKAKPFGTSGGGAAGLALRRSVRPGRPRSQLDHVLEWSGNFKKSIRGEKWQT